MRDIFAWTPLLEPLDGELSTVMSTALGVYFTVRLSRAEKGRWRVELKQALRNPQMVRQN